MKKDEKIVKFKEKEERNKQYEAAIEYCERHSCRGDQAISSFLFPLCNATSINARLDKKVIPGQREQNLRLLTNQEESDFITWLNGCAANNQPKNRIAQGEIILEILKGRTIQNSRVFSSQRIPLSGAAKLALKKNRITGRWFRDFYARNCERIVEKVVEKRDKKRIVSSTKETVQEHFYGDFGLLAELKNAGIIDNNNEIDRTRLLNWDETPQFIDYVKVGAKKKNELHAHQKQAQ
eukprot:Pompholyxophrys_sp_v1_NODE_43_length_3196_cov_8.157275.p2 type:complete len:237 gc:universal NODE_43_length_3196_cov_8.157275:2858-2148(-)